MNEKRDPLVVMMMGMMFLMLLGMGLMFAMLFSMQRSGGVAPGPSPVNPLAGQIALVMQGESAKQDACQFGCYFDCLAELAQEGNLTTKQQAVTLFDYTGKAGKRFIQGDYPGLPNVLKPQLQSWSQEAGELTPADRAALVSKFREIAKAFHTFAE